MLYSYATNNIVTFEFFPGYTIYSARRPLQEGKNENLNQIKTMNKLVHHIDCVIENYLLIFHLHEKHLIALEKE